MMLGGTLSGAAQLIRGTVKVTADIGSCSYEETCRGPNQTASQNAPPRLAHLCLFRCRSGGSW